MKTYYFAWVNSDGGHGFPYAEGRELIDYADTLAEAIELARETAEEEIRDWNSLPAWHDWEIYDCESGGEPLHEEESFICESEPDCEEGGDHDWKQISAWGSGGGVEVIERCARCAIAKKTNTWVENPKNGNGGYEVVIYGFGDDDDDDEEEFDDDEEEFE